LQRNKISCAITAGNYNIGGCNSTWNLSKNTEKSCCNHNCFESEHIFQSPSMSKKPKDGHNNCR